MVRAVFLLSSDLEMASDIVDEVFSKVLARDRRGGIDDLRSYLWRCAFNEAKRQVPRHRRVESCSPSALERTGAHEDVGADDLARAVEVREVVWRGLDDLDETSRQVLLLRYFADFSNPDIAKQLGVPLGTIKSTVHRGLAALRAALPTELKE